MPRSPPPKDSLAARVEAERLRRGLSIRQAVDVIGIDRGSYYNLLNGVEPRDTTLRKFAGFIGEAPPPFPMPAALAAPSELDDLREGARRLGYELTDKPEVLIDVRPSGSIMTHVMTDAGLVYEEQRRPDGSIARRGAIAFEKSLFAETSPARSSGAEVQLFSPPELHGIYGYGLFAPVLDLELQRIGHDTRPLGKTQRVEAKIPEEEAEALKAAAWKRRVSVSELIRGFARALAKSEEEVVAEE